MPAGQGHYYGLADALGGMIYLMCGYLDHVEVMHAILCIFCGRLDMHGVCITHQQIFEHTPMMVILILLGHTRFKV